MGLFYFVCVAVFLTCSQQPVVDVLAVATLCTCSATEATAKQIYSAKTKDISIAMYITILNSLKVLS